MKNKIVTAIILSSIALSANANVVHSNTYTSDMKVKLQDDDKDNEIKITSDHEVVIRNDEDHPIRYAYSSSLCADNWGCETLNNSVEVGAHGEYRRSFKMERKIGYHSTGNYEFSARTEITGQDHDVKDSHSKIVVYRWDYGNRVVG